MNNLPAFCVRSCECMEKAMGQRPMAYVSVDRTVAAGISAGQFRTASMAMNPSCGDAPPSPSRRVIRVNPASASKER